MNMRTIRVRRQLVPATLVLAIIIAAAWLVVRWWDKKHDLLIGFYRLPHISTRYYGVSIANPDEDAICPFYTHAIDADSKYIYLTYGAYSADWGGLQFNAGGLRIMDVSDPTSPCQIGFLAGYEGSVRVREGRAYIASGKGLSIVDVSEPSNSLNRLAFCELPESGGIGLIQRGIYVTQHYAYVSSSGTGLHVIDISEPSNPKQVGFCDMIDHVRSIYVVANYAYATSSSGLHIIDVSNPSIPCEVGFCDSLDDPYGIQVVGRYAYVTDTISGLSIIDISDPREPQVTGSMYSPDIFHIVPWGISGIYIVGEHAYIASDTLSGGIDVVDISNRKQPKHMARLSSNNPPRCAWAVVVVGDYVYVLGAKRADVVQQEGGLYILKRYVHD